MTDIKRKLYALVQKGESAEVEFKSARGGFPGSFWESYSAFANTNGGAIILGVQEKDGKFLFDGLSEETLDWLAWFNSLSEELPPTAMDLMMKLKLPPGRTVSASDGFHSKVESGCVREKAHPAARLYSKSQMRGFPSALSMG